MELPKVKKTIKNFLSDESGKITKKQAIGLGVLGSGIAGCSGVDAAWEGGSMALDSWNPSGTSVNPNDVIFTSFTKTFSVTAPHCSYLENGSFSYPQSNITRRIYARATGWHTSHGSHGSHGQW